MDLTDLVELSHSRRRRSIRRPRVAFTTSVYDRTDVGGGTFVHYLRRAVEEGKLDLVFFSDDIRSATKSYERRVFIPDGIKRLPGGWLYRGYYFHRAVLAEHAVRPFDIIWHNNVITSLLDVTRKRDIPIVGMVNDYNNAESRTPFATRGKFGGYRAFARHVWYQIERYAASRADHIVVNSKYMSDLIRQAYDLDPARVKLLYKGVDLNSFEFFPTRAFDRPVKILFVKQDFVRGGLFDLLKALADFPEKVQLTIIGPPPESHEDIRSYAAQFGRDGSLEILGHVPRSHIGSFFRDHDILCIPSRSEALGVAFMEALASGLAAVGTNVGGIPEILDSGRAGWLAEPQNPESIRRALLDVIENEPERREKIRHGREHVRRFSHEVMIRELSLIASSVQEMSMAPESCV